MSDWVLLAEDRLAEGEYLAVLMEGSQHIRTHGEQASVRSVVTRAVEGYLEKELAKAQVTDAASARAALEGVEQTRVVLGEGAELAAAELAAIEAKAHERLGQLSQAEAAYRTWLGAAPADHPERKRMLLALQRVQRGEASSAPSTAKAQVKEEPAPSPEEVERALALTHGQKELVQHGLVWLGYEIGRVDGVLGRRSQAAMRAYQEEKGLPATGQLTAQVSEALQVLGKRQVEKVRAAERGRREPGRRFRDCDGTWCPELVVVPAGSFMMGSPASEAGRGFDEGPRHRVTIGKPFAVGVTEVTFAEWAACRRGGGCTRTLRTMRAGAEAAGRSSM